MEAAILGTLLTIATPLLMAFHLLLTCPSLYFWCVNSRYQVTRHCGYFLGHSSPLKKSWLRTQLLTSAEGMNTVASCLTDTNASKSFPFFQLPETCNGVHWKHTVVEANSSPSAMDRLGWKTWAASANMDKTILTKRYQEPHMWPT